MNLSIVERPAFSVIGIHGVGKAIDAMEWIQPLWAQAFERRAEIENYIKPEAWGLMSGHESFLIPWQDTGRYLAGWETTTDTVNAHDWDIWHLPAHHFATVKCTLSSYSDALDYLVQTISKHELYTQSGAIHEFYPASFNDPSKDSLYLCMMINHTGLTLEYHVPG